MLILIMIRMDGQTRLRKASANQKRSRWARTDQRTNWNRLIQICHGPSPVTSRRHVIHGSMFGRKCHQHHQRRQTNPPIRTLEIQLDVNHWRNESHMISRNHIQIVHGKMLTQSELQFYSRDIRPVLIFSIQPRNKQIFLGKKVREISRRMAKWKKRAWRTITWRMDWKGESKRRDIIRTSSWSGETRKTSI